LIGFVVLRSFSSLQRALERSFLQRGAEADAGGLRLDDEPEPRAGASAFGTIKRNKKAEEVLVTKTKRLHAMPLN